MPGVSANPRGDARSVSAAEARADAERSGRPFLLFRDGNDRERVFQFGREAQSATVGRRSSSDLTLDWDDQVSRLHARFERSGDSWVLVDDGLSSNGTFVNGERVDDRRPLRDGDSLRFGNTTVTFRSPPTPQARDQARSAPKPLAKTPLALGLSSTQRRVLIALCRPYQDENAFATPATDQQIADELVLSIAEVRAHLRVLSAKLGVDAQRRDEARARLVERAFSDGLISERDF
jgi:pSer/pThr/pTyr-binding forkhead associated (FHA) protein